MMNCKLQTMYVQGSSARAWSFLHHSCFVLRHSFVIGASSFVIPLSFVILWSFVLFHSSLSRAAAQDHPRFKNVTDGSGLKIADKTGVGGTNPHAVAVEDFDGDGLYDVILLTFGKPHVYYFRNLGNLKFKDVTAGSGLENFEGEGTGVAVADFDKDGFLDLYTTSVRGGASRLYRGLANGKFEDVSAKAGVLLKDAARSCAWADVDGDGWVDLYVTSPKGPNFLFRNNQNSTFTNFAKEAGVELADRHCLGCVFGDIDGDGQPDLFVTNYDSQPSALFRNAGGKFEDITATAGLNRKASSVGCILADVFNSGRLDLYVTTDSWLSGANYTEAQLLKMGHTVEPNLLYRNNKEAFARIDGPFSRLKTLGHDAIAEDLDHDGLLDLYVAVDAESGNKWATSKGGNPLWTRTDGKTWKEVGKAWGVHHEANCVCCPAADFDNDGDLDLLLVTFYTQPVLLRNETNDKNWLRVRLESKTRDRNGIGAKITLREAGKKETLMTRHLHSGAGYCRCSPIEAHFGLGPNAEVRTFRLLIELPGSPPIVREAVAGQRLTVRVK